MSFRRVYVPWGNLGFLTHWGSCRDRWGFRDHWRRSRALLLLMIISSRLQDEHMMGLFQQEPEHQLPPSGQKGNLISMTYIIKHSFYYTTITFLGKNCCRTFSAHICFKWKVTQFKVSKCIYHSYSLFHSLLLFRYEYSAWSDCGEALWTQSSWFVPHHQQGQLLKW